MGQTVSMQPEESSNRLESYLEQCKIQGQFDSVGQITVDVQAQVQKLSKDLLLSNSHALLKIIQGLVGSGCSAIHIIHRSRELAVFASDGDLELLPQELSLVNLLERPDDPHRDLMLGLVHLIRATTNQAADNLACLGLSHWSDRQLLDYRHWQGRTPESLGRPQDFVSGFGLHLQSQIPTNYQFDISLLRRHLFFAPPRIFYNGTLWGKPSDFETLNKASLGSPWDQQLEFIDYHEESPSRLAVRPAYQAIFDLCPEIKWAQASRKSSKKCRCRIFQYLDSPYLEWPRENLQPPPLVTAPDWLQGNRQVWEAARPVWANNVCYICELPSTSLLSNSLPATWMEILIVKRGVLLAPIQVRTQGGKASIVLAWDNVPVALNQFSILESQFHELGQRAQECLQRTLEIARDLDSVSRPQMSIAGKFLAVGGTFLAASAMGSPIFGVVPALGAALVVNRRKPIFTSAEAKMAELWNQQLQVSPLKDLMRR